MSITKMNVGTTLQADVTLYRYKKDADKPTPFSPKSELEGVKSVLLRTLPGACTPTCSNEDLPDILRNLPALTSRFDKIILLTSDNLDVLIQWQQTSQLIDEKMEFWADPKGVLLPYFDSADNTEWGRGQDYCRMAFILQNGTVTFKAKEEDDSAYDATTVAKILRA